MLEVSSIQIALQDRSSNVQLISAVTAFFPSLTRQTFNRSDISKEAACAGSQCLFAFYGGETAYHRYIFPLQISNLLIFLWLVNFGSALEQCTLAGTFSSYYWAKRKPEDVPPRPLLSSFGRALRSDKKAGLEHFYEKWPDGSRRSSGDQRAMC